MSKDTLIHPETGETLHRDVRLKEFSYKGEKFVVDMPGWYPEGDGEAIFSQKDLEVSENEVMKIEARLREKSGHENFQTSGVAFA